MGAGITGGDLFVFILLQRLVCFAKCHSLYPSGVILIVVVVALLICAYKMGKRRRNLQQHPTKVEDNPLYGTYGVNGDQNDYTTVQDTNDYYF